MDRISQDNPTAALELDLTFELKAESARLRPQLYKKGKAAGTREIVVHPNYVMVYRVNDETVDIVRVMHTRQKWP